jgi:hypothetical protein
MSNQGSGLTRREMLKRGAIFGGALVWATPVVQTVGMSRAYASHTSPPQCDVIRAVKIEILETETSPCGGVRRPASGIAAEYCCEDISNQQVPVGPGQCLAVTEDAEANGCDHIAAVNFVSEFTWEITFDEDCFYLDGAIELKAGAGACEVPNASYDSDTRTLTISKPSATAPAISHVEIVFCCEDHD